ncbi:MAG: hypothetical protein P9M11_11060 [Candidatus Tenebribacter burtonii]|jgi:hypothetical protein|nr:hypothetical protein [Candidatus Tenebribacter burtonii]
MLGLIGIIFGIIATFIFTKYFINFKRISNISHEIKIMLIEDFQKIIKISSDNNDVANEITVNNIRKINPIIQKYFFLTKRKMKRKKIERHYNEYKEPYEIEVKDPLDALEPDKKVINPISFCQSDIENAYERTRNHLEILIDLF